MFTTPEPTFNPRHRASREKALKWANLFVAVASFLCFAITTADVEQRAGRSVEGFWVPGDWEMNRKLESVLTGCVYQGRVPVEGWDVTFEIDENTRAAVMAHTSALIRRAVWITGASVVLSALNKLLFDRNIHEIPNGSSSVLYIRKGWLTFIEIGCLTWSIIALQQADDESSFISDYIDNCTDSKEGVSAPDHIWEGPPFVAMFVAHSATLLMHVITFLVYYKITISEGSPALPHHAKRSLFSLAALRNPSNTGSTVEAASFELLSQLKTHLSAEALVEGVSHHHSDPVSANPLPPQRPVDEDAPFDDYPPQYPAPAQSQAGY